MIRGGIHAHSFGRHCRGLFYSGFCCRLCPRRSAHSTGQDREGEVQQKGRGGLHRSGLHLDARHRLRQGQVHQAEEEEVVALNQALFAAGQ